MKKVTELLLGEVVATLVLTFQKVCEAEDCRGGKIFSLSYMHRPAARWNMHTVIKVPILKFFPLEYKLEVQGSPARLHKHAKLHIFSSHSFASPQASLAQEVADMAQDLAIIEVEPACIEVL